MPNTTGTKGRLLWFSIPSWNNQQCFFLFFLKSNLAASLHSQQNISLQYASSHLCWCQFHSFYPFAWWYLCFKTFLNEIIIMGPVYIVSEKTQEKACREHEEDNFSSPWCYFIFPDSNIWAQFLLLFCFFPLYMTKKVERLLWFEDKRQDEQRE